MTAIVVISAIGVVLATVGAGIGITYWLRPAGRIHMRRYIAFVSVLCVLLAAFAITNAVKGDWVWSLGSVALLAAVAMVAYRAMSRARDDTTRGDSPRSAD